MSDPIVYGFTRSTFVNIVRMVLTHKEVPYTFRDLEPEMGKSSHLALHPFNRVPILQHGDFVLCESPISMRPFRVCPFSRATFPVGRAWTSGSVSSIHTSTRT